MGAVRPIPELGGVVRDVRGGGRALRVSWHDEDGLVVLSLWDGPRCTGTVRLAATEVPTLVEALQLGLRPPVFGAAPGPVAPIPYEPPGYDAGRADGLDILDGPGGSATG
jgi:hypothetical protein